jgi:hypothetical protein
MKPSDTGTAKLLRWYPRAWRERYGEEFLAMVEDSLDGRRPGWRDGRDQAGRPPGQAAAGQGGRGRAGTMTILAGIPQLFRLL